MKHKYIIIINSSSSEKIQDKIRNLAEGYFLANDGCALVTFNEKQDVEEIREKLMNGCSGAIVIIEVFTTGIACARGEYASTKTWNWITNFCTEDNKEIKNKVLENYKKQQKQLEEKNIPNSSIREDKNENGIGL